MNLQKCLLTKNPCYTSGRKIAVKGLMLHSVGCPQPSASVFVKNWNKASYDRACVHAFIDGNDGTIYQTLPWTHRGWHCGASGNNTHIGVEMCEPACIKYTGGATFTCSDLATAQAVAKRTYRAAVELFAMLCQDFSLDPLGDGVIVSHKEGCKRGIASNHGDPEHLWTQLKLPYTMDTFRADVAAELAQDEKEDNIMKQDVKRYNAIAELPAWSQPAIIKMVDKGIIGGSGKAKDENGRPADLDLSVDMVRIMVTNDRAGLYD